MAHKETVEISVTPATARKAAAGVSVAALLCLLGCASLPLIAHAQQLPQQPNAVRQQLAQAGAAAAQVKPSQPKPAAAPPNSTPTAAAKPSQGQTKAAAAPAKPATGSPEAGGNNQTAAAKGDAEQKTAARRDPFAALFGNNSAKASGPPERLPPGIAGLVIATLHVDGIVSAPSGMIAIVSNPQQRVYFLHEGDHLYDGTVQHIGLDMIAFHETGKDPFGKPVDREVSKMLITATPGEEAP